MVAARVLRRRRPRVRGPDPPAGRPPPRRRAAGCSTSAAAKVRSPAISPDSASTWSGSIPPPHADHAPPATAPAVPATRGRAPTRCPAGPRVRRGPPVPRDRARRRVRGRDPRGRPRRSNPVAGSCWCCATRCSRLPAAAGSTTAIIGEHYWRIGELPPTTTRWSTRSRPGVSLRFIHRPLSRYVHAMGEAGLADRRHGGAAAARAAAGRPVGLRRGGRDPRVSCSCALVECTGEAGASDGGGRLRHPCVGSRASGRCWSRGRRPARARASASASRASPRRAAPHRRTTASSPRRRTRRRGRARRSRRKRRERSLATIRGITDQRVYAGFLGAADGVDRALATALIAPIRDRFPLEHPQLQSGRLPDPDAPDEAIVNASAATRGDLQVGQRLHFRLFDPATVGDHGDRRRDRRDRHLPPGGRRRRDDGPRGLRVLTCVLRRAPRLRRLRRQQRRPRAAASTPAATSHPRSARSATSSSRRAPRSRRRSATRCARSSSCSSRSACSRSAPPRSATGQVVHADARPVARRRRPAPHASAWRAARSSWSSSRPRAWSPSLARRDRARHDGARVADRCRSVRCMTSTPVRGSAIDAHRGRGRRGGHHRDDPPDHRRALVGRGRGHSGRRCDDRPGSPRSPAAPRPSPVSRSRCAPTTGADEGGVRSRRRPRRPTGLALCAAFVASAVVLIDTPADYGFDADLVALNPYGDQAESALQQAFGDRDDVVAATGFTSGSFLVDGRAVPGVAATPVKGELTPTILRGPAGARGRRDRRGRRHARRPSAPTSATSCPCSSSAPRAASETTGDPVRLRIVGVATFPAVSQIGHRHAAPRHRRARHPRRVPAHARRPRQPARVHDRAPGRRRGPGAGDRRQPRRVPGRGRRLRPPGSPTRSRPSCASSTPPRPTCVGALIVGFAILLAVFVHALWTRVHANRHDLAVLRVVGCTRRQLDAITAWQAAPFAVGAVPARHSARDRARPLRLPAVRAVARRGRRRVDLGRARRRAGGRGGRRRGGRRPRGRGRRPPDPRRGGAARGLSRRGHELQGRT